MPPYNRLTADSAAAPEKLVNVRSATRAFSDGSVKVTLSVPKNDFNTAAAAPENVEWPDAYEGNGGVVSSGVQVASAVVFALPSVSAARIAVIGRQNSVSNLTFQH